MGKNSKLSDQVSRTENHPANLDNYQNGNFYNVEIELINPDPNQPRKFFNPESLNELSISIQQKGVLQPVIIRKENEKIFLVAGERRYRAAKMAGLTLIPAVLTTGNAPEIALIENLQREDLKPIEEAEALKNMMDTCDYTQEKLAFVIGKARSTITETLSLNKLPEIIKEECRRADNFSRRVLVEIAKQKTEEEMLSLFNQVKNSELKSNEVRKITRKQSEEQKTPAQIALGKTIGLIHTLENMNLGVVSSTEKDSQTIKIFTEELKKLKEIVDRILSF